MNQFDLPNQAGRATAVRAVAVFGAALIVYWGTAVFFGNTQSPQMAYFDHLADAFLHGRLYLSNPPAVHDLTRYQGQWYVPFPPLPALLLLPWVAIGGVSRVNTVLFSTVMGALNVALIYLMLEGLTRQGWTQLDTAGNLWLTLLFGLGSVHWYMATDGAVWFVSQICTVTFIALAAWIAISNGSPWLTGAALALALLARPNVIFAWPLLVGSAAMRYRKGDRMAWRSLTEWAAASVVPLALAVVGLLWYNAARFGNPLDFGYLTENVADKLVTDLHTYGQFSLHYLPRNLWAMWLALPVYDARAGMWLPNQEGMSLLLTTPALVYLVRARARSPLVIGAWLAFGLLLIPLALYYNTGWVQFGYRFSLDFMVPVMVLLAVAAGQRVSPLMRVLIGLGVLINALGVVWWHR